jgi:hypothetical protein
MHPWLAVFLGIIAVGSLVQVGLLVAAAVVALRAARAFARLRDELRRETRLPLANVSETVRNMRRMTRVVGDEVHTLRRSARHASDEVVTAKAEVKRALHGPVARVAALRKAMARGVAVYRDPAQTARG